MTPLQNYGSEQNYKVDQSPAVVEKPARKPRQSKAAVTVNTEKIRKELETELTLKIKAELTTELEAEIKSNLEVEYQKKLEKVLAESVVVNSGVINPEVINQETIQETKNQPKKILTFDMETKQIVEAILFAAEKPMTAKQLQKVYPELERPELSAIQQAIDSIVEDYLPRPVGLKQLANGYRFQVKDGYSYWVSRIFEEKPPKYSRALLETVAIIAYRQPVTRGDVEDIRGVSVSSNIIRTLLDREWIRVIAHKEVPGRPALYGSTKQFLDYFNLKSLDQLPTLDEIQDLDFAAKPAEITQNELELDAIEDEIIQPQVTVKEKTIEEQAIEEAEREEQEIIELVLENKQ